MRFAKLLGCASFMVLSCVALTAHAYEGAFTTTVNSAQIVDDTGIFVNAGQVVTVTATGTVDLAIFAGGYVTDPSGLIVTTPPAGSGSDVFFTANAAPVGVPPTAGTRKNIIAGGRIDGAAFGALVAGISPNPAATSNVDFPNGFILIGTGRSFTASASGYLYFAVNDIGNNADNAGSFSVTGTIATQAVPMLGSLGMGALALLLALFAWRRSQVQLYRVRERADSTADGR